MPRTSKEVKLANKASSTRLAGLISSAYEISSGVFPVQVLHSRDLRQSQRNLIWALYEANMHELYKGSSFGWDPPAKRTELFHSLSRFILVNDSNTGTLLAFTMFRFEFEEGENVVYCYELQVTANSQGMGLGKTMLSELTKFCETFEMEKIMLTVLKANAKATSFYKAVGFNLDPTSPNYVESDDDLEFNEIEDVDYEILSKNI